MCDRSLLLLVVDILKKILFQFQIDCRSFILTKVARIQLGLFAVKDSSPQGPDAHPIYTFLASFDHV